MAHSLDEALEIWYIETVEIVESWREDGASRATAQGRELLST